MLTLVIGSSLLLFAWRTSKIGLGGSFDLVSRESMLLTNNVFLVVAAGSVLLGTLYPLFLDALNLGKISVGPPYFETVFVPLMTPALFLMGVGPITRWKEASLADLARKLRWALGVSVATALLVPLAVAGWSNGVVPPPMVALELPLLSRPLVCKICEVPAIVMLFAFMLMVLAAAAVWAEIAPVTSTLLVLPDAPMVAPAGAAR